MTLVVSRPAITTTRALLAATVGRMVARGLVVTNRGTAPVFLGGPTVTAANGFRLDPGASLSPSQFNSTTDALWAVADTGTRTLHVLLEYGLLAEFPAVPIDLRVEMFLGSLGWVDVTDRTYTRDGITISRGLADEAGTADPATCSLTLKNLNGDLSPRNPMSPYYGLIGRNTPLRVSVGQPGRGQVATGAASTSHVAPSVTAHESGSLLYAVFAANATVNYIAPAGMSLRTETDQSGTVADYTQAVPTGPTGTRTATSSASTPFAAAAVTIPGPFATVLGQGATSNDGSTDLTVTSGVSAMAGDWLILTHVVAVDASDQMAPLPRSTSAATWMPWQLLADTGAVSGRARIKVWAAKAWVAEPAIHTAVLARVLYPSIGDVAQHARLTVIADVEDWHTRFVGEISDLPTRWDLSGNDVFCQVTATGITRRLGQGVAPLRSAIYRAVLDVAGPSSAAQDLLGYWPCEDAAGSTSIAPAMFPGSPITAGRISTQPMTDGLAFAAIENVPGSLPLPDFSDGGATFFPAAFNGAFSQLRTHVRVSVSFPVSPTPAGGNVLLEARHTNGERWQILYLADHTLLLAEIDEDGNVDLATTFTTDVRGTTGILTISLGPSVSAYSASYIRMTPGFLAQSTSGSIGPAAAPISRVRLSKDEDCTGVGMGHVLVSFGDLIGSTFEANRAWLGWAGTGPENAETTAERILRLALEERVPASVLGLSDDDPKQGPQTPLTLLELLSQAAEVETALLVEAREEAGLLLRPLFEIGDAGRPALELSYNDGHLSPPLEPTDDDQRTRNDITVTLPAGTSARSELTTGPLSTLPPPAGVGRYDTTSEVNARVADDLGNQANLRLRQGTWDQTRYPSITVDLAANPALVEAVAQTEIGDRITLTDLPAWLPPEDHDAVILGYSETIGPFEWRLSFNTIPYGPYRFMELTGDDAARLHPTLAVLAASLNTTATTTTVTTTGAQWITTASHPADFPFEIVIGGELTRVTGITATSSPQTFTLVRSLNGVVKSHAAGAELAIHEPYALAL